MKDEAFRKLIFSGDITKRLDLDALFGAGRRVEVDIGSGMGRFILARAAAHPDVQFIGIERLKARVEKIAKKAWKAGLTNVFMVRLEATYVLKYLLPANRVSRFYLFFPDPWPKRRHAGHRVFNDAFRSLVWSRLAPGGDIQVATDSEDYFADMCRQMADDARFERIPAIERPDSERTDFELLFMGQGLHPGAAGFRARPAEEVGAETVARYAAEDAVREEAYWNEEMPHAESVHIVGIGGVGMSALAQAYLDAGAEVTGSDRLADRGDLTETLRALQAQGVALFPQDGSGIGEATTKVIVSTAIEADNKDLLAAQERGIEVLHRSAALAELVADKKLIAVAGTSGKSTTTAILGWLLAEAGLDPVVINGAAVVGWGGESRVGSVRAGEGEWCVIEADESDRSFLRYNPVHAIVTNQSADHFDLDETHRLFAEFKSHVTGTVVDTLPAHIETEPASTPWKTRFTYHGKRFTVPIPGYHNVCNAWQALELASALGVPDEKLRRALLTFPGVERRLQRVGTTPSGAIVVDDYGHNPAKLAAAIAAVQAAAPSVTVFWRPHGYTPLRHMLADLADAFAAALRPGDHLVLPPVYDAGGTTDRSINSDALADAIRSRGLADVEYWPDWTFDEAHVTRLGALAEEGGAILVCGARDPDLPRLARALCAGTRRPPPSA
ncbi:MAG: tRNA (guanosine(46)-N7)-methyltransferase TrmB [Kiritimatiellae bacterium]|nr:tRNA (guanosine(46)-N7)-methyltransferase TrmB [Kiritimatiellia bacterium]